MGKKTENDVRNGKEHITKDLTDVQKLNTENIVTICIWCLTLCNPKDCSSAGLSVRGIFQARILEWVAISYIRGSSQPRDRTQVS